MGIVVEFLEADIKKKTLATLVITATIFALGLAATALGAIQSKSFDSTTTPQEVIDIYKSGLPFKCPPSQADTTSLNCDRYISFIPEDR